MGKPFFGLRGSALNYAIGLVAGCDFLLFGYGKQASYLLGSELLPINVTRLTRRCRPGCHWWYLDDASVSWHFPRHRPQ